MQKAIETAPAVEAPVKLDLACGQTPKEGFEGVDFYAPGAKHKIDLLRFPWPWKDSSVDEIHCSHFIEHIPMAFVESVPLDGNGFCRTEQSVVPQTDGAKDLFFAFFDECWRILKKDATMLVICPNARNDRAFQDPTHRRFIVAQTFLYLHEPWRKANKLDHYNVRCNFEVNCDPVVPMELTLLHPEAQMRRFNESWNVILDWNVKLIARKG